MLEVMFFFKKTHYRDNHHLKKQGTHKTWPCETLI